MIGRKAYVGGRKRDRIYWRQRRARSLESRAGREETRLDIFESIRELDDSGFKEKKSRVDHMLDTTAYFVLRRRANSYIVSTLEA